MEVVQAKGLKLLSSPFIIATMIAYRVCPIRTHKAVSDGAAVGCHSLSNCKRPFGGCTYMQPERVPLRRIDRPSAPGVTSTYHLPSEWKRRPRLPKAQGAHAQTLV